MPGQKLFENLCQALAGLLRASFGMTAAYKEFLENLFIRKSRRGFSTAFSCLLNSPGPTKLLSVMFEEQRFRKTV